MIAPLLIAAAIVTSPSSAGPSAHDLLNDAQHAIDSGRIEQASIMIARAVAARASGPQLARTLADLAFAKRNYDEALVRYQSLVGKFPNDPHLLERAGVAALELGDADRAKPFLLRATELPNASWRAWNARGVADDIKTDWSDADQSYERAAQLAPKRMEPVANHGWSLVLRGQWQDALPVLQRAAALAPRSKRVADNLELAQEALASDLPQRLPSESDLAWAERLNDAGVAAAILGNRTKATAAFTQALEANGSWYERAANNLEAIKQR
jgi:Flp pilus assembly protein TadD